MNHNAIRALYPTVVTIDDSTGAFDAQGNQVQIDMVAVNAWVNPELYKSQRQYPPLGDQLDMLWHAIDNGTLNKTSDFYTAIKAVKDAYPKSE
jgi:hypothetical protein